MRPKILIVSGYHPKEIFAVKVGEQLLQHLSNHNIKVVKYTGKPDRKGSICNLRQFIEELNPVISPIILHGDDDISLDAAIIYCVKLKQEERKALQPLLDFIYQCNVYDVAFDIYLTKYNLIELELNSKMGLQKATSLVERFSKYLLYLYLEKGLKS